MKKLFLLFLVFCLTFSLTAGISPQSKAIGKILTKIEKDSIEYKMKKAFSSELTDSWLEMYTVNTEAFIVSYLPLLSSILPMENLLISKMENGRLSIYSQKSGLMISLVIENGLISAIGTETIL